MIARIDVDNIERSALAQLYSRLRVRKSDVFQAVGKYYGIRCYTARLQ